MSTADTAARGRPLPRGLQIVDGVARALDRGIEWLGRGCAWLTLVLVLLVAGDVIMRYGWHVGSVAEQELQWHLLAVIAMISASYTLQQGEHVRVDIFYQYYSARVKSVLEVVVSLLVVVPCSAFLAWMCLDFVVQSWALDEGSADPGGLPARYVIKAFVPLGFALVGVQGLASGLRELVDLWRPAEDSHGR